MSSEGLFGKLYYVYSENMCSGVPYCFYGIITGIHTKEQYKGLRLYESIQDKNSSNVFLTFPHIINADPAPLNVRVVVDEISVSVFEENYR